ncbi:MAG: hypothetical protein E3J35_06470 [Methanomassiliicoccales archaeon]|nr:MAG: hypothetical protein E3J35_06470 [Methanomassiliicoccales archaeon]
MTRMSRTALFPILRYTERPMVICGGGRPAVEAYRYPAVEWEIMTVIRLGKTRESKMFTAEQYKEAIREYMEAMGYAQTTDSMYEGDLPDMVFVPLVGTSQAPPVWVEAKAGEVSISDKDFVHEIHGHLNHWLRIRSESRFHLKVFARRLRAPTKWEAVFGDRMTEENVLAWLGEVTDPQDLSGSPHEDRLEEIVSFFSEIEVVEGTGHKLIAVANKKRSVGLSALEISRRAQELWWEMRKRARPIPQRSNIVGSLLKFHPPIAYAVLSVDAAQNDQIRETLKGSRPPPYQILSEGKLLTIWTEDVETAFRVLNPTEVTKVDLSHLERESLDSLIGVLNSAINRMIFGLGARRHGKRYYFVAHREVSRRKRRRIPTPSGRSLTVAKPVFVKEDANGFVIMERPLNFVFHLAFEARCRRMWDEYFIGMRLRRLFTEDGLEVIEGEHAARIDKHYRNPIYNRADTQQAKLAHIAWWVFRCADKRAHSTQWMNEFRFGDFLKLEVGWTPNSVDMEQKFLSDFDRVDTYVG